MTTLHKLVRNLADIPMSTAWYLSDLAEAKGRQQLFTRQSPQRLLYVLKEAYRELETRVGATGAPRGEKTETVIAAVERTIEPFSIAELLRECPGVSVDLLRHVLNGLKAKGRVECLGRGPRARWRRLR